MTTIIPKINKIAIFLIVAFILNLLYATIFSPLLTTVLGTGDLVELQLRLSIATIVSITLGYLVNIVVAIWLYAEAKKQNERPWTWVAFALFFGLMAAIIFFLILVIRELRALRIELNENQKN